MWCNDGLGVQRTREINPRQPYAVLREFESFTEAVIMRRLPKLTQIAAKRFLAYDESAVTPSANSCDDEFLGVGADHAAAARAWCEEKLVELAIGSRS